jgi:hypothetical protein
VRLTRAGASSLRDHRREGGAEVRDTRGIAWRRGGPGARETRGIGIGIVSASCGQPKSLGHSTGSD